MKYILFTLFFLSTLTVGYLCFVLASPHVKVFQKPLIVCTTSIITDAVKQIGGQQVEVYGLMGAGVDPHLYRPRPSDMQQLLRADLIFYNGLHLEGKMSDIFAHSKMQEKTVAVGELIDKKMLIQTPFDTIYDPHIWHDPLLWIEIINIITNKLIKVDSQHTELYQERSKRYTEQLLLLHQFIEQQVATLPPKDRVLVSAHDAFSYFGQRYGFTIVALQGISTEADIGVRDVQKLTQYILDHQVRAIFVESCLPLKNIQAVQQAVSAQGWTVNIGNTLYADALGSSAQTNTYIGMMKTNINHIVQALKA